MDSLPIILLCLTAPCGLFLLVVAGIALFDPLTYTEFFDELQETLGIKPPVIRVKESLIVHRILLLGGFLIALAAFLFALWQGFF
jgi:hypothetical protein